MDFGLPMASSTAQDCTAGTSQQIPPATDFRNAPETKTSLKLHSIPHAANLTVSSPRSPKVILPNYDSSLTQPEKAMRLNGVTLINRIKFISKSLPQNRTPQQPINLSLVANSQ